ncbi:MAG: hypothetical protein AAFQ65_09345 [Myxococcota bacterium]
MKINNHSTLGPLAAAVLLTTLLSATADAGGVITHGRETWSRETPADDHVQEQCDAQCLELYDIFLEIFSSHDAVVSQQASLQGVDVSVPVLDAPENFGIDVSNAHEAGCSASGAEPHILWLMTGWFLWRRRLGQRRGRSAATLER